MASVEFATILALGAALLAGIGYVTLQRSARQVTAEEYVGHFTLFHLSLRHALWWLGSLAAVASFTLQAIALRWVRWCWCSRCRPPHCCSRC